VRVLEVAEMFIQPPELGSELLDSNILDLLVHGTPLPGDRLNRGPLFSSDMLFSGTTVLIRARRNQNLVTAQVGNITKKIT
jgi:hypothetical protein